MTSVQLFANKHTVNGIRLVDEISDVLCRAPFQFDPIHKYVYKAHYNDFGFSCLVFSVNYNIYFDLELKKSNVPSALT